MDHNPLYLVLDQGSHASRAIVFNSTGRVVSSEIRAIATQYPREGRVEHDPEVVLESLRQAMATAVAGRKVAAAGLATQRSSVVCWNRKTGQALSPVISWRDVRAHVWMESFSRYRDDIHAATGLFPSAHYGASKLHWCLAHLPEVRHALEDGELAWGPLSGFLLFRLLDERPLLTDPGNASRTLLWNLHTGNWDAHLLDMFHLPRQPLPRCVPNRHDFGHLHVSGQRIPVRVVTGDLPASLFAAGWPQNDMAYINAGTGAFVQRVTHKPMKNANGFLSGVAHQTDDTVLYSLEGTVNGAGSALEWFGKKGTVSLFPPGDTLLLRTTGTSFGRNSPDPASGFAGEESKLSPFFRSRSDPISFEERLPQWLERAEEPPLFLNGISGLGSPFWRPVFESRFIGEGEVWQQAVAVVESIVFLLNVNLEGMAASMPAPGKICISGGLASLSGLCQRMANLAGIPVIRPVQSEATARGCAFLLAGCPGNWPEAGKSDVFQPIADARLMHRYARWKALMESSL